MIQLHDDLREFLAAAAQRLDKNNGDSFFSLEEVFQELVFDCDFLSDHVNAELDFILRRPLDVPERWRSRHVIALEKPEWRLTYGVISETAEFIRSNVRHVLIAVLGPEPLIVDRYPTTKTIDTDVFDAAISLGEPHRTVYKPGSVCVVDSREGIADLVVENTTAFAALSGRLRRKIQWIFSRQTLRAVQSIPSNPEDAEIAILIRALTAMRGTTSVATLCELTTHESHFVRWTALQALLELSPEAARSSLLRATNDAHPQVRSASEKAIAAMAA